MRFLCLHGMGTNSQVFEMQTAPIRYELGDGHTYEFVEGTIPHPMAPGIASLVSSDDQFYCYVDKESAPNILTFLDELEAYIEDEGPFDGVMAFSEGAALASMLMIRKAQQDSVSQHLRPLFRCAIFFSGGVPADPATLQRGDIRLLGHDSDGELIELPTAHVWGQNDKEYPTFGPVLSSLCQAKLRSVSIFEGGHEVPGSRDQAAVVSAVHVIRRTVAAALDMQYG